MATELKVGDGVFCSRFTGADTVAFITELCPDKDLIGVTYFLNGNDGFGHWAQSYRHPKDCTRLVPERVAVIDKDTTFNQSYGLWLCPNCTQNLIHRGDNYCKNCGSRMENTLIKHTAEEALK